MPNNDPNVSARKVLYVENIGDKKYTYYDDGVVKITKYKRRKKVYWGRVAAAAVVLVLVIVGLVQLGRAIGRGLKGHGIRKNSSVSEFIMSDTDEAPSDERPDLTDDEDTELDEEKKKEYGAMNIRVCIDPGHGDYDTGAVGNDGILESEQALDISLLIRDHLEKCGVTVTMTRESDVSVSLSDRCSKANEDGCDLFVSVHRTSATDTSTDFNGIAAWVNSNAPEYDVKLAQNLLDALESVGVSQNLGIQYGYRDMPGNNYQVNMDTVMPSCMIEIGYVTSEQDNELFLQHKQEYAEAIGDAIIETAIQLGVINEDGERQMTGQLISKGKNKVYMGDDETAAQDYTDDYQYNDGGYNEGEAADAGNNGQNNDQNTDQNAENNTDGDYNPDNYTDIVEW